MPGGPSRANSGRARVQQIHAMPDLSWVALRYPRLLLSDGKDPLMDSVSWRRIEESYGRAQELNLS